jgi:predicted small metal-binding protein
MSALRCCRQLTSHHQLAAIPNRSVEDRYLQLLDWRTGKFHLGEQQPREAGLRTFEKRASMKTMTCKDLGGTCDQKLSAESWDEMVGLMVKHVTENHPDVAKRMERMHNEDPKKWGRETKPKWEATPND